MRKFLTPEQIKRIMEWYEQRQKIGTSKTLAKEMGVSRATIQSVFQRQKGIAT